MHVAWRLCRGCRSSGMFRFDTSVYPMALPFYVPDGITLLSAKGHYPSVYQMALPFCLPNGITLLSTKWQYHSNYQVATPFSLAH